MYGVMQLQKPSAVFVGSRQMAQTPLVAGTGRALNVTWDPGKFNNVFEIADADLRLQLSDPSWLSIDITDDHIVPQTILPLGPRIMQQRALYSESTPWLWVIWFDLPPVKVWTDAEIADRER
jgi:hypothetical protein